MKWNANLHTYIHTGEKSQIVHKQKTHAGEKSQIVHKQQTHTGAAVRLYRNIADTHICTMYVHAGRQISSAPKSTRTN